MSAAEIRMHLRELQLERLEAESYGLDRDQAYMQDLESERIGCQRARLVFSKRGKHERGSEEEGKNSHEIAGVSSAAARRRCAMK